MRKTVLIFFSVICFFCACFVIVFNFVMFPERFKAYVDKYSVEFGVDRALVYAVIKAESGFDKNAKSKAGAVGLMQIMPSTAIFIANELDENNFVEEDLFDEQVNIRFGCFYLKYLFNKFLDVKAVVCAYNAGETVVRTWLGKDGLLDENKIVYAETRIYLKKVLRFYEIYKNHKIYV